MTSLSDFLPEEEEIIVSLPYRVGMHVSYAEDEDGEDDDEKELRALENALKHMSGHHSKEQLPREIFAKTLHSKEKWDEWAEGVFNIEPICEKAVLTLSQKASSAEVRDYISMVLEVASMVAQAYGEFGEEAAPEKGFFGKALSKITGGLGVSSDGSNPMNVSAAEDSAISRITTALKRHV